MSKSTSQIKTLFNLKKKIDDKMVVLEEAFGEKEIPSFEKRDVTEMLGEIYPRIRSEEKKWVRFCELLELINSKTNFDFEKESFQFSNPQQLRLAFA